MIETGRREFILSKAVILILSVSMLLIFLFDLYGKSGQPALFKIVFYSTMLVIAIAFDVHMWNVLRYGGTRVIFTVTCPEETDYRVRLDGKRRLFDGMVKYRGPIDDEIRCKRGRHTLSVESGGSVVTAEIDVDEVAFVRILIRDGIYIEPDDYDWTREPDPKSMEIKAVLLYAAFCFFMTAMTIVTVFFQEIRSGRSHHTLRKRVTYDLLPSIHVVWHGLCASLIPRRIRYHQDASIREQASEGSQIFAVCPFEHPAVTLHIGFGGS